VNPGALPGSSRAAQPGPMHGAAAEVDPVAVTDHGRDRIRILVGPAREGADAPDSVGEHVRRAGLVCPAGHPRMAEDVAGVVVPLVTAHGTGAAQVAGVLEVGSSSPWMLGDGLRVLARRAVVVARERRRCQPRREAKPPPRYLCDPGRTRRRRNLAASERPPATKTPAARGCALPLQAHPAAIAVLPPPAPRRSARRRRCRSRRR